MLLVGETLEIGLEAVQVSAVYIKNSLYPGDTGPDLHSPVSNTPSGEWIKYIHIFIFPCK